MNNPDWYDNWPDELKAFSMRTTIVPLTFREREVIQHISACEAPESVALGTLKLKIADALKEYPGGAFIKLSSRSPKDNYDGYKNGFKCTSADRAIELMTESERMHDDSHLEVNLLVREWIDMKIAGELRCFRRDGEFIAACQYEYSKYFGNMYWEGIAKQAVEFYELIKPHLPESIVFDLYIPEIIIEGRKGFEPLLIELNPFDCMTDPCLFSWEELKTDAPFQFRYNVRMAESIPLDGND